MNPVSEEKLLQILRVEEPLTIIEITTHLRDHTLDEIDACLWELHRQGRSYRNATTTGEWWYFGESKSGTPTNPSRSQAELAAMMKHCLTPQSGDAPIKATLAYVDGNPYLIVCGTWEDGAYTTVTAWDVLPDYIASKSEPERTWNPITLYQGVRFLVGKQTWVVVGPQIIFTAEKPTMAKKQSTSIDSPAAVAAAMGVNTTPAEFRELPLDQIVADPQIRRFFDAEKLQDLADSIAQRGVDTPILVRPMPDEKFHIIAGERRFRASRLAGKSTIPALVKLVDNAVALEMQIDENEQRENLHPLEAAEGYQALMQIRGWDLADLAAHLGKSHTYLRDRLRLLDLPQKTQEAMWDGNISLSSALEIATIRDPESQLEITRMICSDDQSYYATAAQVRRYIRRNYFRLLSEAKFPTKDKSLVPEAGACTTCLKRSKAQSDLFESEFTKKDSCLDKACWERKQAAFVQIELKKAKESGHTILPAKTVKEILPYSGTSLGYEGGKKYVRLDDKVHEDIKGRTYGQILGDQAKVIVAAKDGEVVHLLERSTVREAIKKAAPELTLARSADPKQAEATRKIEDAKHARKIVLRSLFDALEGSDGLNEFNETELQPSIWRVLATIALRNVGSDGHRMLRTTLDLGDPKNKDHSAVLREHVKLDCADPLGFLFQCVLVDFLDHWVSYGSEYGEELRTELFAGLGFDVEAEMKKALASVAESRESKGKNQKAKAKGK